MVAKKTKETSDEKPFSALVNELEKKVSLLESGEVELEDAIDIYEAGMKLAIECQERLKKAEARLLVIDQLGNCMETPEQLSGFGQVNDE